MPDGRGVLQTTFDHYRFELYYGSLILVGLSLVPGQLPAVLGASSLADVSPFAALLVVGGIGLATSSALEALHSDRAQWESKRAEGRVFVAVTIGFGAVVAGALVYGLLIAV